MKSKNNSINFFYPIYPHFPTVLKSLMNHETYERIKAKNLLCPNPAIVLYFSYSADTSKLRSIKRLIGFN